MGQGSIIREQQQAFAVVVETTDGIQTRLAVYELHYSRPALGIRDSRDVSSRLIQGDIFVTLGPLQKLVVDADRIDLWIGLAP